MPGKTQRKCIHAQNGPHFDTKPELFKKFKGYIYNVKISIYSLHIFETFYLSSEHYVKQAKNVFFHYKTATYHWELPQ